MVTCIGMVRDPWMSILLDGTNGIYLVFNSNRIVRTLIESFIRFDLT